MEFCTAINCMDGRTQLPVINFLKDRFNAQYVDVVTEPGTNLILGKQTDRRLVESIFNRVDISLNHHHSKGLAVVGHYDCAGNPAEKSEQISHLKDAVTFLEDNYPKTEIIALWVDENWNVNEI
ncbi:carbonic anhydrase [Thermodesulfobacteriota bacterium]